jgi:hypothetical protein
MGFQPIVVDFLPWRQKVNGVSNRSLFLPDQGEINGYFKLSLISVGFNRKLPWLQTALHFCQGLAHRKIPVQEHLLHSSFLPGHIEINQRFKRPWFSPLETES